MSIEISVDSSVLTKVVNGRVKKLRITRAEARKVMAPYAKAAHTKIINAAQSKTKLGKADLKSRIRLTNKRAGGRRKGKHLLFYQRFYIWGRSSIVHVGRLLSPSARPTGKGANRGLTIKGKKYRGAFIHPDWGANAGGKERRVLRAKPGGPGRLESVNLDYNILYDVLNRYTPVLVKRAGRQARSAARALIKKKLSGSIRK